MAKQKPTLEERIDDARAEHAATEKRIVELQDELAQIPARIQNVDWSNEEWAIAEVAELERRRDGLPHYLRHLRKQAIEQEIALYNLETEEAEERRQPLNVLVEEFQEEFDRARDALNGAKGKLHELIYGELSDLRRNISDAEKRLHALEREGAPETAPVVRSVWQLNNPAPEEYPQDTPASHHFGSANVTDKPLSVGEKSQGNVVIPERAREKLDRAG